MLAKAYIENRQLEKAIEILEDVVEIRQRILAPSHPQRLASEEWLAMAYVDNKQPEKAIEILESIVQRRRIGALSI
jgi:tetratricopeptide (TPR) repeat protein